MSDHPWHCLKSTAWQNFMVDLKLQRVVSEMWFLLTILLLFALYGATNLPFWVQEGMLVCMVFTVEHLRSCHFGPPQA